MSDRTEYTVRVKVTVGEKNQVGPIGTSEARVDGPLSIIKEALLDSILELFRRAKEPLDHDNV